MNKKIDLKKIKKLIQKKDDEMKILRQMKKGLDSVVKARKNKKYNGEKR